MKCPAFRSIDADVVPKQAIRFPNSLTCLVTLLQKAFFLVILVGSLQYTVYDCLATSFFTLMIDFCFLNYLTGDLVYLPCEIGGIIAVYTTGRILDRDYIRTAKRYNLLINKFSNDIFRFPIEEIRLLSAFPLLKISTIATFGFGWSLHQHTSIVVSFVLTFFSGVSQVAIFTICRTFLTNLNFDRSATVQANYNLIRCTLNAGGIAALQALIDTIEMDWCFTFYDIIDASCIPIFMLVRRRDML